MPEPRNRNLVERALLESIIGVAGRMLARNVKRGAQVRHALIIGFSDEPGFTLDGRTVLENCTFMRWNLLSEDTRIRLVAVREALPGLRGKNLACWCRQDGKPCHADVLLELANR